MNIKILTVALVTAMTATAATAGNIIGVVKDKATGEPLIGTVVSVKELKDMWATTGLDGSFTLNKMPDEGRFTLVIKYMAYKTVEVSVDVKDGKRLNIPLEEDTKTLGEVVIKGRQENRTDRSALLQEKNATSVLNVMSAQTIQLSPDMNVAGVLQRVSGVTMEKDATGEASYAILRGMDKRYNYTLVNGVKIPSPDDKNRYIPLNIFPSDLMDRLVVAKSLTADMEGDAAGGVVDMVMKDAPSRRMLQANASVGLTDYFMHSDRQYLSSDRSDITRKAPYEAFGPSYKATADNFADGPTRIAAHSMPAPNFSAGIAAGNRFWNDRLGIMVAGSVQNNFRGTERTYNTMSMASGEQAMFVRAMQHRFYSIHDLTSGLHAKFDLQTGGHKLEWYNMFIRQNSRNTRLTSAITTEYITADDYTQNDETRSFEQTQTVLATHLKGTHRLGENLTVDWAGIFSEAREKDPDRTYLTLTSSVANAEGQSMWASDKTLLKTQPMDMERRYQHNSDKDLAGYVNITYATQLFGSDIKWKAGAQYRRKKRENRYFSYQFDPSDISQKLPGNGFDVFDDISWKCTTPYSQASQLNYNSKEHIGGTYAMFTMKNRYGELYAGIRAEHTNQIYTMLQKFRNMGQVGEQSYWDWLPSASFKWTPTKNMNLRLSYYRSINRPGFYEIVPYQIMGEEYTECGNPALRRARIDNVDLRWEWFPSPSEQVLAGVFYKYLRDPIEQVFVTSDSKMVTGSNTYYQPQNLGNAKNMGFEVDVVKFIRHFGLKANYTYTHSSITTSKRQYKPGSAEFEQGVKQTRPLVNQAPHTANLSLLYRGTTYGWNAQLAASYTGTRLAIVSPFKDADQWDKGTFGLDLSAEKRFPCGLSIFLKANNLTDTKRERYIKTVNESNLQYEGQKTDRTVVGTYHYGRTLLIGIRYSL